MKKTNVVSLHFAALMLIVLSAKAAVPANRTIILTSQSTSAATLSRQSLVHGDANRVEAGEWLEHPTPRYPKDPRQHLLVHVKNSK